jgi:hypothetical protein
MMLFLTAASIKMIRVLFPLNWNKPGPVVCLDIQLDLYIGDLSMLGIILTMT